MVLDRAFQKPKPKVVNAPPPAPVPRSRRDSAREPWQSQYDDVDDSEAMAAAVADDEDEEMNLATLLNVIDGQVVVITFIPVLMLIRGMSTNAYLLCRSNVENPGRILIMTSNYPERLDKALVRKVCDYIISFNLTCRPPCFCYAYATIPIKKPRLPTTVRSSSTRLTAYNNEWFNAGKSGFIPGIQEGHVGDHQGNVSRFSSASVSRPSDCMLPPRCPPIDAG